MKRNYTKKDSLEISFDYLDSNKDENTTERLSKKLEFATKLLDLIEKNKQFNEAFEIKNTLRNKIDFFNERILYFNMMDYIHPASSEYDPNFVETILEMCPVSLDNCSTLVAALLGDELTLEQKKLLPRR
ncbi:MAG: hypothetical protein WCG23_00180 [bacterium]